MHDRPAATCYGAQVLGLLRFGKCLVGTWPSSRGVTTVDLYAADEAGASRPTHDKAKA